MLGWIGHRVGFGAYPTINRKMAAALNDAGIETTDQLNIKGTSKLVEAAVTCHYPPLPVNQLIRPPRLAAWFTWEFPAPDGIPRSFIRTLAQYDRVFAMSSWVADQLRAVMDIDIEVIGLGIDPSEFTPSGSYAALFGPPDIVRVLYVGGTDKRHGLDLAIKAIELLPEKYHLFAFISSGYPLPDVRNNERVHILRGPVASLAPLYRAADVLIHPARAVGFSMPLLEAAACGLPIAASKHPVAVETAPPPFVYWAEGGAWSGREKHHIHADCAVSFWETPPAALADAVRIASNSGSGAALLSSAARAVRTWHDVARDWKSNFIDGAAV